MLVRLLVALQDPDLEGRLARLDADRDLVVEIAPRGTPLHLAAEESAADILLADRHRLGLDDGILQIRDVVDLLRRGGGGPEVVYLAVDEDSEAIAVALAAGCLAVLDARTSEPARERALLAVIRRWRQKADQLRVDLTSEQFHLGDFVTVSPAMARFMRTAHRVANSTSSILILGETGVGKERLASAIHFEGPRRDGPFVVVNCGAIPESLMESELFGHEKGSFTGADRPHRGYFEMAHGGTLFLDEIGELPRHLQVTLLRAIQEKEIRRIGAEGPIAVDVRLIAATNRDLRLEMAEDRFRADLFYRLSVVTLTIPPLRDRREDIPPLVRHYLERFRTQLNGSARTIEPAAMEALKDHSWPGNVREVINVIERAVLLCEGDHITLDDLPEEVTTGYGGGDIAPLLAQVETPIAELDHEWFELPLRQAKRAWADAFERTYLHRILGATRGRIGDTARHAGIDPRSLYDKMRRFNLDKQDYKRD